MPVKTSSNSSVRRLQAVSSHFVPPLSDIPLSTTMASRDPITCHVLDTTAGRPASDISVTLSCRGSNNMFTAVTNSDGRIAIWQSSSDQFSVESVIQEISKDEEISSIWTIKFDTGAYFGTDKTFFPEVEVTFFVKPGQHYHVPLLLSPYSYSTYRGS
jgi:5-hydroxyisourate hydrolase